MGCLSYCLLLVITVSMAAHQALSVSISPIGTSCTSELVRLKHDEALSLNCASECSGRGGYGWWKVVEGSTVGQRISIDESSATLTKTIVPPNEGGGYVCKCLPDGPECQYNVTIIPEVTFTASEVVTHFGDVFDLTCIMEGFPAETPVITNGYGVKLPIQIKKTLNDYKIKAFAVIDDAEEEDFVCSVETYYEGNLVGQVEKAVSVKLYEPPSIIYTTEYIIHSPDNYGKPGVLTCTIQTSPDTESHVSWWANGTELHSNGKYEMDSIPTDQKDVRQFLLKINNLQQSDIGSYLCQLNSDFALEETHPAWIQVDFRKGMRYKEMEVEYEDYEETSGTNTTALVICGLLLAICAVMVYRCLARRRTGSPIIGYSEKGRGSGHSTRQESTGSDTVSGYGVHGSVMRRK